MRKLHKDDIQRDLVIPTGDKVLVRVGEKEELKTESGLIIVQEDGESVRPAEVLRVGYGGVAQDGKARVPIEVRPGDKVLILVNCGIDVGRKGFDKPQTLLLIKEEHVVAITKRTKRGKAKANGR